MCKGFRQGQFDRSFSNRSAERRVIFWTIREVIARRQVSAKATVQVQFRPLLFPEGELV